MATIKERLYTRIQELQRELDSLPEGHFYSYATISGDFRRLTIAELSEIVKSLERTLKTAEYEISVEAYWTRHSAKKQRLLDTENMLFAQRKSCIADMFQKLNDHLRPMNLEAKNLGSPNHLAIHSTEEGAADSDLWVVFAHLNFRDESEEVEFSFNRVEEFTTSSFTTSTIINLGMLLKAEREQHVITDLMRACIKAIKVLNEQIGMIRELVSHPNMEAETA